MTYRELQQKLKELRNNGVKLKCKLNSKKDVLQSEFNRLTVTDYSHWEYEELEKHYIGLGFQSLASFLLYQKQNGNNPKKEHKHTVRKSDIRAVGSVVGFTKEGYSIVAKKKTVKGFKSIFYVLHDPTSYVTYGRQNFADVQTMVEEINSIIDFDKTEELAWW